MKFAGPCPDPLGPGQGQPQGQMAVALPLDSVNATHGYATSARSLSNIKFDVIIQEAQAFMKPIRHSNRTTDTTETINVDDEQACLVDNSDESASGGAECMLVLFCS